MDAIVEHTGFASNEPEAEKIIKLAVMALGGQGGGVLAGWIEKCARSQGYAVQTTSVAGVAQRTGATFYYLEMAPNEGKEPVFALMPSAGDVDIVIAAELMEAGRAVLRGFVTPDRTTLIASTHRALAVSEKIAPGDGRADSSEVMASLEIASRRLIADDMEAKAAEAGTVISASLFGALAGSSALPFAREAFESAVKDSGRRAEASLIAFESGFQAAAEPVAISARVEEFKHAELPDPKGKDSLLAKWRELELKLSEIPAPARDMAYRGLRKVVEFQDLRYGREYLDKIALAARSDREEFGFELTREAAKHVANAMAYDDVIRVADLKTRRSRFVRIRGEAGAKDEDILRVTEFMHPRAEEICGMLPAKLGRFVEQNPRLMRIIDRLFNRSRRLRSDTFLAFIRLYVIGGMKWYRRSTLRHAVESDHLENWLTAALIYAKSDYRLGVESLRARRLIKGYSDTHSRGQSKFDKIMNGIERVSSREDAARWARLLREAALKDSEGTELDGMLSTISTFASVAEFSEADSAAKE
ncbi:MAG: indolepyruvate oxidoreductase subunit beta family protein [Albidovulum sp.]|nr:indolepyruvate oxidoreductase subunit beta family protein [Albidovulum sp.]MDE0531503.1 indolepyruvate oxidoreductase subunit beta family protein [Albidovulum sp.]